MLRDELSLPDEARGAEVLNAVLDAGSSMDGLAATQAEVAHFPFLKGITDALHTTAAVSNMRRGGMTNGEIVACLAGASIALGAVTLHAISEAPPLPLDPQG